MPSYIWSSIKISWFL